MSEFDRVYNCPISLTLPDSYMKIVDDSNVKARFLEELIEVATIKNFYDLDIDNLKFLVSKENLETMTDVIMYVQAELSVLGDPVINVYEKVDISEFVYNLSGVADIAAYDEQTQELHIFSLDIESNTPIKAESNSKLCLLAIGIVSRDDKKVTKIVGHVVQPHLENFDSYVMQIEDISETIKRVKNLAANIMAGAYNKLAGSHCRVCPKILHCPVVKKAIDMIDEEKNNGVDWGNLYRIEYMYAHKYIVMRFFQEAEKILLNAPDDYKFQYLRVGYDKLKRRWKENAIDIISKMPNAKRLLKISPLSIPEMKKYLSVQVIDDLLEPARKIKRIMLKSSSKLRG